MGGGNQFTIQTEPKINIPMKDLSSSLTNDHGHRSLDK